MTTPAQPQRRARRGTSPPAILPRSARSAPAPMRARGQRTRGRSQRTRIRLERQRGGAAESTGHVRLSASAARAAMAPCRRGATRKRSRRSAVVKRKRRASAGLSSISAMIRRAAHAARRDHEIKLVVDRERQHAGGGRLRSGARRRAGIAPAACRRAARSQRRARRQARADRFPRSIAPAAISTRSAPTPIAGARCAASASTSSRQTARGGNRFPGRRAGVAPANASSDVADRATAQWTAKQAYPTAEAAVRSRTLNAIPMPHTRREYSTGRQIELYEGGFSAVRRRWPRRGRRC